MEGKREEIAVELTPEMKRRIGAAAAGAAQLIQEVTASPIEAFFALHFMKEALQKHYGIEFHSATVFNENHTA